MGKRYRLAVLNTHPIQYFAPLYRRIAESPDIDITVYYCSKQSVDKGFVDLGFGREVVWDIPLLDGYPYKFLPNLGADSGVGGGFFSLVNPSIISELWRGKYDALLLHGHNSATNLLALFAGKLRGTRVFMRGETHLLLHRHPLKRALRGPLMRVFYSLCDACLYIGTRNRDFYLAHGVPANKLFFVPYTVDNQFFTERAQKSDPGSEIKRIRLNVPRELPIILYASKLIPRKRPRDLLLAHAELSRRGVRAALVFVGDGEERASLEREVAALKLSPVVFAGFVNQSELPTYYSMASVFVLPSDDEPWGLVINEVMCCGVPVVTTSAVGAAADLVQDGQTGFTYQAGDVGALADALSRLMQDANLRQTMSKKCMARMKTWSYVEAIGGIRQALSAS